MRMAIAFLAFIAACSGKAPRADTSVANRDTSVPNLPHPPIGFVGRWAQVHPDAMRGDTLTLRADSTADGIIVWRDGRHLARISRWFIQFTSRDPVASRADLRHGHKDSSGYTVGGDPACVFDKRYRDQSAPGCISLPEICLGVRGQYACDAFALTADSLLLSGGARYVRVRSTVTAAKRGAKAAHPSL